MADTSQHELSEPHTNGAVDGLTEEEKSKMRPADIDADMREMERRKRVEMMMNSRIFREELERIIETQMKDGGAGPSGLLQQISDMMGAQGARFNSNVFKSSNCVVPINDIRGVESMGYAKGEKLLRCKLAAVFRLLDLYGWTQGVGGHITARLNQDQEHFLVNPYGLLYHEVTASSLVKVDMQGTVVEQGTTNFGVHVTGFQLHSTIHAARPDIKCIVHITTPSVIAVSSLKCGLLPLGQESIVIGEASVHQYIGGVFEPEEKEKIARNLGPVNKIMFLTNRGAICCGETVEEAFYNVYNTVLACETQLKLIPAGIDNLTLVSEESRKAIFDASRKPPVPQHPSVAEPSPLADKLEKRWRIGGTEFEALMRMLDNAGFRTGYIYRNPLVKGEPPRPRNDVEVPPAVSSLGYLLEEEELYRQGLWKGGRKGTDRSRWLNSPNVYQKVEILETGTPDPKKITKWVDQNAEEWVTDGSPTHSSTPVKIESALQFVPKNTNPKEFKQLQQQIKDYRRADKISAGPQSHILEGVTWDEAKKMQDATISATGEQVVLVGAASKGIIQRGFQHNAMVYKTPYAKNPFDAITDQELDQYKKDVERKQKGDPYDESQSESEALSSFNVSRATHESSTAKSPIQSPVSVTSETEEESRDEPRVLRIETKQVPLPSQPEVVLSDEPTSVPVVVDSPIVQQALIQQVQQQSQTVNQQRASVDATSEFLNEMRRASAEPRNDINRRDCLSSNSSSVSSGNSFGWPNERYDKIHLEVARSRTIAPRMTPLITEIVYSSKNKKLEQNNIKIKLPPPVPPKPKPYIALRNAFLNNYPPSKLLQVQNSQVDNNRNEIYSVDYCNADKGSGDLTSCSMNGESRFSSSRQNRDTKFNQVVSVSTDVMKDSCVSKGDNKDREIVFQTVVDINDNKPVIVGAILKNVNEIYTLCLGSDEKTDLPESKTSLETKFKESEDSEQNLNNISDENGNFSPSDQEIGQTTVNLNSNNSPNDNDSNSQSLNISKNLSEPETGVNQVSIDLEDQDLVNNNPDRQSLEPEIAHKTEGYFPNDSTTPPRTRNWVRLDSVTEVINSMKIDLTPTKMMLSVLPESNISSKYYLDSTNMSLIYSLTPTSDDTDIERRFSRKKSADMLDESFDNGGLRRLDSCNTENSVHDEDTEFIWVDLATDKKDNGPSNEIIDLTDNSMESFDGSDQGSDILELPYSTVKELRENYGESFDRDINTGANQIIADLGDIEMYTHASNFIDEILYDISCLKFDQDLGEGTVYAVVQDKLNALGIAKDIANSLVCDLPCYDKERAGFIEDIDTEEVIVIDEIVHHVVDKSESSKAPAHSSPDFCNLKKAKECTNTELKEMQNNFKTLNKENETDSKEENIEVITIIDIDEELELVQQDERVNSDTKEVEIDVSGSIQTFDESFRSEGQESLAESNSSQFQSSDERFFITLESFSSPNNSRALLSEVDVFKNAVNIEEEINDHGECQSGSKLCPSPLDCDDCSFIRFKKYEPIDADDEEGSDSDTERTYVDCKNATSSLENTESDITDQDTLGEAILEFCTIAKPGSTAESLELNFSIQNRQGTEKSVFLDENSECRCCGGGILLDLMSPGHLPPIFEESNENLDNSGRKKSLPSRVVNFKSQFDCLDSLSDSEILIAPWFEYVAEASAEDKPCLKSPDHSAVSLESATTVDFYSCKDDSNSTAFQSLQNTAENSPKVHKDDDSDLEIIYVADNKLDRTYTLSDTSINSLDTVSSIESDEQKQSNLVNITYSADISTNIDEACKAADRISSSSSSDARLSNDENCFDTTANMADVSGDLLISKFQTVRSSGIEETGQSDNGGESRLESSLILNSTEQNEPQDCMVYSYDTKEFMRLEEALAGSNRTEIEIHCTCSEVKCEKFCTELDIDRIESEPIGLPPRYEDTTLYRVISEINLNDDIVGVVSSDLTESPK